MEGSQDAARAARRRLALAAAVAATAVFAIVAAALLSGGDDAEPTGFPRGSVPERQVRDLGRAARVAGCSLSNPPSEGNTRTSETVEYRSDPPHSGDHAPEPAPDGAYRTNPPPTEKLVHALYHGRIVIWFRPDLADDALGGLKALFDESRDHMLLVPRPSMEPQVAATAWTHVLACGEMRDAVYDAIRAFREKWRNTAPEFVP